VASPPGSKSTNFFEHPIDSLTARLGLQNSEGTKRQHEDEAANAEFLKAYAAANPKLSRAVAGYKAGEPPPAILAGALYEPGKDSDKMKARKKAFQLKLLRTAGAPGSPEPE
jgi:hypothetical protein